jgi:hypothetical protein
MESNVTTNGNEPATKQDIFDFSGEMRAEMKGMEDRLVEAFRDAQTELLKAFYRFAESNRQRVTQLEGNQAALITGIGVLEDRMLELERKVNFPSHSTQ